MDHKQLLTALKPQEVTSYSKNLGLLPEENRILELKYKSPAFGLLPSGEVFHAAATLLLKIHVITGWEVPQKELMDILVDQFCKKIVESYPTMNADEIEYAFRNKPAAIKEWGKALSISIIDEVVLDYLEKRVAISAIEDQKKLIEHKKSKEELDQIDREYEAFKNSALGKRLLKKNVEIQDLNKQSNIKPVTDEKPKTNFTINTKKP